MQQTVTSLILGTLLLAAGLPAAESAYSAGIAQRGTPDPLLQAASGPCDLKLDSADYAAGTDVDGNPVAAADLKRSRVPAPDSLFVGAAGGDIMLDGKTLDPLLNPKPACPKPLANTAPTPKPRPAR